MKEEYDALIRNNTWTLVAPPAHKQPIGCKWVFRVKENPDGTIHKYKARLVAKGSHQQAGSDFTETFSPVVKPVTVRTVLTIAVSNKWPIQQIDVNNAFLNGILEEEVYMQQPQGFEASDRTLVCKLNKALYGLKQAPRAWFDRLKAALIGYGFSASKCDPSLFMMKTSTLHLIVLVYVDDIIITGSSLPHIQKLITKLNAEFALKQLGTLDYFLGIEVFHLANGALLLSQAKYIRDLLSKAKMDTANGMSTPMASTLKLSKIGSVPVEDPTLFRSIVGALQYATLTRPEIAFSVNKVCQFLSNPLEEHWKAVKRILRYLSGTLHYGLLIQAAPIDKPLSLIGFCDADWASDPDDRRSTSGACIYVGPNLVSWWSKKQSLVARSSAEAEYRSLAILSSEILWLQSLLTELGCQFHTPKILCDNLSTVSLAHNPTLHHRTKHMELDIFFVREKVLSKNLVVSHVPAQDQWADVFTKPLSAVKFCSLRNKLRVFNKPSLLNPSSVSAGEC
jgi:histone deacetylase 1/2